MYNFKLKIHLTSGINEWTIKTKYTLIYINKAPKLFIRPLFLI
jgi:hypothetical protein